MPKQSNASTSTQSSYLKIGLTQSNPTNVSVRSYLQRFNPSHQAQKSKKREGGWGKLQKTIILSSATSKYFFDFYFYNMKVNVQIQNTTQTKHKLLDNHRK